MAATQKSAVFRGVEELCAEECLGIARRKLASQNVEVVDVAMETLSDTPVGFLGDHYKVKMTTRQLNTHQRDNISDSESIDLHFFVKTKPRNPSHTEFAETLGAFEKERDFFDVLLTLLAKYVSEEVGKNVAKQIPWTANSYLANSRLIVLDDLSRLGFRILDNRAVMDYEHCAVLFKTLARFHASSIIFEERESQRVGTPFRLNEAFPQMFKETIWSKEPGNSGRQICEGGIKAMFTLIKRMPRLRQQPERYESVCNSLSKLFDDVCQLVAASNEYKNVVSHGDLWANNILFKYDATGRSPEDARLVDFQLLRYTAPAHDFMCALYLNTRRDLRDKYLLDLALVYHLALATELGRYGVAVEEVLPWSEFKSSLRHYRRLGILTCCMYFPASLLPSDAVKDLFADHDGFTKFMLEDRSAVASSCFGVDDIFTDRIIEITEELAEFP